MIVRAANAWGAIHSKQPIHYYEEVVLFGETALYKDVVYFFEMGELAKLMSK
ncbi:hypothetical protein [Sphingobacterium sp. UBA6320]|jgi:hypothetical protein|uniref:hypothetical protein n=1 Tax=Sphingobacterium sp. UBA6320 TaxID=1947510 RepID=UPI0025E071D6|nr:hypothetical protein [Sphingobacterium sp. UBA6320]